MAGIHTIGLGSNSHTKHVLHGNSNQSMQWVGDTTDMIGTGINLTHVTMRANVCRYSNQLYNMPKVRCVVSKTSLQK